MYGPLYRLLDKPDGRIDLLNCVPNLEFRIAFDFTRSYVFALPPLQARRWVVWDFTSRNTEELPIPSCFPIHVWDWPGLFTTTPKIFVVESLFTWKPSWKPLDRLRQNFARVNITLITSFTPNSINFIHAFFRLMSLFLLIEYLLKK